MSGGIDVEVIRILASELDFKFKFKMERSWDTRINGTIKGVMGSVSDLEMKSALRCTSFSPEGVGWKFNVWHWFHIYNFSFKNMSMTKKIRF